VVRNIAPLRTVVGASNELPEEKQGLEALYDRFLLRYDMNYLCLPENFQTVIFDEGAKNKTCDALTDTEILACHKTADDVILDPEVKATILAVRKTLLEKGLVVSDRRWKQAVRLIRVAAAAEGKKTADGAHVLLLKHMLWNTPAQKKAIADTCFESLVHRSSELSAFHESLKEFRTSTLASQDYTFPSPLLFDTPTEASIKSWRTLNRWASNADINDFYATTAHNKNPVRLPNLFNHMKKNYGWDMLLSFDSNTTYRITKELNEFTRQFDIMRTFEEAETDRLRTSITTSLWLTASDRAALKTILHEKESMLKSVIDTLALVNDLLTKKYYLTVDERGFIRVKPEELDVDLANK